MLGLTAEQIGTVILGLALGIIGLMGGHRGKQIAQGKVAAPRDDVVEVAGAIVSDKAVSRMVQSLDEFSAAATVLKASIDRDVEAKGKLTTALIDNSRALERNSETADDMLNGMRDTSTRMDRLKEEIIRSSSSHGLGYRP